MTLLSEKSEKLKLLMWCDIFAYNFLKKMRYENNFDVWNTEEYNCKKFAVFDFFDIFVDCWCAHKSEVEIIVLMCKYCNVDVFELFWCENRQVNKQKLRNIKNWRLCEELCTWMHWKAADMMRNDECIKCK